MSERDLSGFDEGFGAWARASPICFLIPYTQRFERKAFGDCLEDMRWEARYRRRRLSMISR